MGGAGLGCTSVRRQLYTSLLRNWESCTGLTAVGRAVQEARVLLFTKGGEFGEHVSVWAPDQHYGDPARTLAD